jgi:MinD superfamily P-loop ATPase
MRPCYGCSNGVHARDGFAALAIVNIVAALARRASDYVRAIIVTLAACIGNPVQNVASLRSACLGVGEGTATGLNALGFRAPRPLNT